MAEYCEFTDIEKRLTPAGAQFVSNRNGGGAASPEEVGMFITTSIQEAGGMIDMALMGQCSPANARAQTAAGSVPRLKFLCVDLAAKLAVDKGGEDSPESIQSAFDRAIETLDKISRRYQIVPGLTYDQPINGGGSVGMMFVNVR